jgi:Transposase IS66 family
LPITNNEAERALRHAIIARRISFGSRSSEGSNAYAALLSVIETCRLRRLNPWKFFAQIITLRRQGLDSNKESAKAPSKKHEAKSFKIHFVVNDLNWAC